MLRKADDVRYQSVSRRASVVERPAVPGLVPSEFSSNPDFVPQAATAEGVEVRRRPQTPLDPPRAPWPQLVPIGRLAGKPAFRLTRPVALVGSKRNAHLHLQANDVSKAHALLLNAEGRVYVRDLASRTRVHVNGQRVREAYLEDGDEIAFGRFTFRFEAAAGMRQRPVEDATPAGQLEMASIPFPLPIDGRVVVIGRRRKCEVLLEEESCSNCHAVIFSISGKRYVRDLGSRSGTFLNGILIKQEELRFGDVIRVGETDLRYAAVGGSGPSRSTVALGEALAFDGGETESPENPVFASADDLSGLTESALLDDIDQWDGNVLAAVGDSDTTPDSGDSDVIGAEGEGADGGFVDSRAYDAAPSGAGEVGPSPMTEAAAEATAAQPVPAGPIPNAEPAGEAIASRDTVVATGADVHILGAAQPGHDEGGLLPTVEDEAWVEPTWLVSDDDDVLTDLPAGAAAAGGPTAAAIASVMASISAALTAADAAGGVEASEGGPAVEAPIAAPSADVSLVVSTDDSSLMEHDVPPPVGISTAAPDAGVDVSPDVWHAASLADAASVKVIDDSEPDGYHPLPQRQEPRIESAGGGQGRARRGILGWLPFGKRDKVSPQPTATNAAAVETGSTRSIDEELPLWEFPDKTTEPKSEAGAMKAPAGPEAGAGDAAQPGSRESVVAHPLDDTLHWADEATRVAAQRVTTVAADPAMVEGGAGVAAAGPGAGVVEPLDIDALPEIGAPGSSG